jgi:hypothetical protein
MKQYEVWHRMQPAHVLAVVVGNDKHDAVRRFLADKGMDGTSHNLTASEFRKKSPDAPAAPKRVALNPSERAALNMIQAAASCAANGAESAILSLTHNVLTCLSEGNVNRAAEYLSEYRDRIAKGG